MNAVKKDIIALIPKELESANKIFPLFQSPHEGYAVLLEEMEELKDSRIDAEVNLDNLWENIKLNGDMQSMFVTLNCIKLNAIEAACEAIQVAAMCDKFKMSFEDMYEG